MANIKFENSALSEYYSVHRHSWEEFYDSERRIISGVMEQLQASPTVLDIGCACGGLGEALSHRYSLSRYRGVDINRQNITCAKTMTAARIACPSEFAETDILSDRDPNKYDLVFQLSCADVNVEAIEIFKKGWDLTAPGGYYIFSVRLTNEDSVKDIALSYQWSSSRQEEAANYVVFRYSELFQLICELGHVDAVRAYGYWGKPSPTAVTPFHKVCFSVFSLKKGDADAMSVQLQLPLDLFFEKSDAGSGMADVADGRQD